MDASHRWIKANIQSKSTFRLYTEGFSILDLDQIIIESIQNNENNNIVDRDKILESLDLYIEKVYDYAYTLAENYVSIKNWKIE